MARLRNKYVSPVTSRVLPFHAFLSLSLLSLSLCLFLRLSLRRWYSRFARTITDRLGRAGGKRRGRIARAFVFPSAEFRSLESSCSRSRSEPVVLNVGQFDGKIFFATGNGGGESARQSAGSRFYISALVILLEEDYARGF